MVDASRMENVLTDAPHPVGQTGWGLFFIFLIKKGKKRDDKDTKGYERSKYSKDNHLYLYSGKLYVNNSRVYPVISFTIAMSMEKIATAFLRSSGFMKEVLRLPAKTPMPWLMRETISTPAMEMISHCML